VVVSEVFEAPVSLCDHGRMVHTSHECCEPVPVPVCDEGMRHRHVAFLAAHASMPDLWNVKKSILVLTIAHLAFTLT
jgi:hypothetical protein